VTFELDEETRDWIRSTASCEASLDRERRERLKAAVLTQIVAGVALPATAAAANVSVAASKVGSAVALSFKPIAVWLVAGVGVGLGVVGSAELVRSPRAPASAHATVAASADVSRGKPRLSGVDAEFPRGESDAIEIPPPGRAALAERAHPGSSLPSPGNVPAAPLVNAPRVEPPPLPSPAPSVAAVSPELRAELELMNQLQAALRDGAASRAEQLIAEHTARFPRGQLVLERQAAEVFAACQLGDAVRARRLARAFLSLDGKSALAARVRASCASEAHAIPTNGFDLR
jgi:hypothetical protein